MAAFVLTARADGSMGSVERYKIDETLKTEPGLREFDFQKATEILESYQGPCRRGRRGQEHSLQQGAPNGRQP